MDASCTGPPHLEHHPSGHDVQIPAVKAPDTAFSLVVPAIQSAPVATHSVATIAAPGTAASSCVQRPGSNVAEVAVVPGSGTVSTADVLSSVGAGLGPSRTSPSALPAPPMRRNTRTTSPTSPSSSRTDILKRATSPFQSSPLAARQRLRHHPMAIAAPMATTDVPTVNGSVIMIISRLASGLAPATVTPNMDWIITARITTCSSHDGVHMPAVAQTVLRTMEFDMAAPA